MANYTATMKTNFQVEIDGIEFGNFISVTGLGGTADISDDIGGTDKNARKIPGKVKYETITLTRNSDPRDTVLRDWWNSVEKVIRRGSLFLLFCLTEMGSQKLPVETSTNAFLVVGTCQIFQVPRVALSLKAFPWFTKTRIGHRIKNCNLIALSR
jgi:phage tail-like protein